jgi:hypothetical protein
MTYPKANPALVNVDGFRRHHDGDCARRAYHERDFKASMIAVT